jgi:ABC-type cobalamin/Fe3+-siderophores transport system ATPase subunit
MEFETEDSVGDLMETVYERGFYEERDAGFLQDIRTELELDSFLHQKTQQLAKGQLQRAIIAFSLLYGSKIIMMDEPVFALEEPQKERAFDFLLHVSEQRDIPIYFSVHNLELSQKYSQYLLLFSRTGSFKVGPTAKLYTRENIEEAYQIPMSMLHKREFLYREMLNKSTIPPQT